LTCSFQPPTPPVLAELAASLPALRILVLSGTRTAWGDAIAVAAAAAPGLEELHLCANGYADLLPGGGSTLAASPAAVLPRVTAINLSDNALTDWVAVHDVVVSAAPSLTRLMVNNNAFAELPPPASPCPTLEQLSLNGNPLASLSSVDALDVFPQLTGLRLGAPDLAAATSVAIGPLEARQLLIARLPRLATLNGSEVRARERDDAEKAYARRVGEAFVAVVGSGRAGGNTLQDLFGSRSVAKADIAAYVAAGVTGPTAAGAGAGSFDRIARTAVDDAAARGVDMPTAATLPTAFSRGGDSGVIRAVKAAVWGPFELAPVPLHSVSTRGGEVACRGGGGVDWLPVCKPVGAGALRAVARVVP
jgi:hypothetical protein